jgi:hypothetical protein
MPLLGGTKGEQKHERRFAIPFAAALVALEAVFTLTACGGGAQQKAQEAKQKAGKKGQ